LACDLEPRLIEQRAEARALTLQVAVHRPWVMDSWSATSSNETLPKTTRGRRIRTTRSAMRGCCTAQYSATEFCNNFLSCGSAPRTAEATGLSETPVRAVQR
jgi:hypothetical protein